MLRYQLTIRKMRQGDEAGASGHPSKFQRLKAGIVAFLGLSGAIGVLLAAFVLGSILAIVILIAIFVTIGAWMVWRFLHHSAGRSRVPR